MSHNPIHVWSLINDIVRISLNPWSRTITQQYYHTKMWTRSLGQLLIQSSWLFAFFWAEFVISSRVIKLVFPSFCFFILHYSAFACCSCNVLQNLHISSKALSYKYKYIYKSIIKCLSPRWYILHTIKDFKFVRPHQKH